MSIQNIQDSTPSDKNFTDPVLITLLEKYGDVGCALLPTATALCAYFRGFCYIPVGILICGLAQKHFVDQLKHTFPRERPRPYYFGKRSKQDNQSFPSSHTAGAFLSVGLNYALYGLSIQTVTLIALSALVGASRVLSKKHWVSDVAAGAWIGFSAGWLAGKIFG